MEQLKVVARAHGTWVHKNVREHFAYGQSLTNAFQYRVALGQDG